MSSLPQKIRDQVQKASNLSSTERIIEFLNSGSIGISPREQEMLNRFDVIDNLLREGKSSDYISRLVESKFKITKRQVARDIIDTKEIFGSLRTINKNYYLSFLLESIIDSIKIAKNEGASKLKEKSIAEKNLLTLLSMIDENGEMDKGIKQVVINITSDPASIGLKKMDDLEARIKKYMKPKIIEATTIEPENE